MMPGIQDNLNFTRMIKNFWTIGSWTLFGRLLGGLKDTLLVSVLGIGAQADAFFLAYRIPQLFRATLAEGSIPGVMVPIFTQFSVQGQLGRSRRLMALAMGLFLTLGLIIVGLFWSYPEPLLRMVAAGLSPEKMQLCQGFLSWLILLLPLFSLASLVGSFLHAQGRFSVQAAGLAVFNLVSIIGILWAWWWSNSLMLLCLGIVVAGLAKLASRWQLLVLNDWTPQWPDMQSLLDLKIIAIRFVPLLSGIIFATANATLETLTASFLPTGQIVLLHYIFRLFNMLLYTISIPLEQVMLPELAKVNDDAGQLRLYLEESLKLMLFLTVPTSLFIVYAAPEICWLLLSHRGSGAQLALATVSLRLLALAVSFNVIQRNLSKFFYALHDTATPTLIWGFSVIFSGVSSLLAVRFLQFEIGGILLITTISWALMVAIKLWLLAKSGIRVQWLALGQFVVHLFGCVLVAMFGVHLLLQQVLIYELLSLGLWYHKLLLAIILILVWIGFLWLVNRLRSLAQFTSACSSKFLD